ncbi:MAG: YbaK/EbsC family protein [Pseudomonadota bacterium]
MSDKVSHTIKSFLDKTGVDYEFMDCDPELADTADFCAHYGESLEKSANAILIKAKTGEEKFACCVLLAHTRLDVNKSARKKLGARRVSFASSDETKAITGMQLGGVTPIGLPDDLPLWVDSRVSECDYIILGAGTRSAKLKVSPTIFEHTANTEFVEGLAKDS